MLKQPLSPQRMLFPLCKVRWCRRPATTRLQVICEYHERYFLSLQPDGTPSR